MHILAIEEYGLRCLLQVAACPGPGLVTGPEIAQREGLGPEYVARIMRALREGGLVESTRGASGGYRLARPAARISVWDAVRVLGGEFLQERICDCRPGQRGTCVHLPDCSIRALWRNLEGTVRGALECISLEDLRRDESSMTAWLGSLGIRAAAPAVPAASQRGEVALPSASDCGEGFGE